jgi:hypothetical protein
MAAPARRTVRAGTIAKPLAWPAKDADEVLDYGIDFTERLDGDAISTATFSLATAAGLVIDDSEHDGECLASVTLSAGTVGSKGKILCRIVTSDGRTMDETVALLIRAR